MSQIGRSSLTSRKSTKPRYNILHYLTDITLFKEEQIIRNTKHWSQKKKCRTRNLGDRRMCLTESTWLCVRVFLGRQRQIPSLGLVNQGQTVTSMLSLSYDYLNFKMVLKYQSINKSINQSTNQSTNQSINLPTNQSSNPSIHPSTHVSINSQSNPSIHP